jgi:mono/diheme cytochrome c family protein
MHSKKDHRRGVARTVVAGAGLAAVVALSLMVGNRVAGLGQEENLLESQSPREQHTAASAHADIPDSEPRVVSNAQTREVPLVHQAEAILTTRCGGCHNPTKARGGLDLTTAAGRRRGGDHGALVVPGRPAVSLLYQRVTNDEMPGMPPAGAEPLNDHELATLRAWIEVSSLDPAPPAAVAEITTPRFRESTAVSAADAAFWSFRSLRPVTPPALRQASSWPSQPIDRFLLAAMESRSVAPNRQADRRTLIRRLSFDLVGLPPTPAEVDAFVADRDLAAYERLVDRLLASPHYGECWGRHWLDLARYADSDGYEDDTSRPRAYPYRDFVIQALNQDLPFNTFLQWQLAGDELAPQYPPAVAATGFATAGPVQTFFFKKKDRYDELDDIVSTIGSAMLGLTVGCARCHDHKYDPIPQKDYYRLVAIFSGTRREERYLVPDGGVAYKEWLAAHDQPRRDLEAFQKPYKEKLREAKIAGLDIPEAHKTLLRQSVDPSNQLQANLMAMFKPEVEVADNEIPQAINPRDIPTWERLVARAMAEQAAAPPEPPKGLALGGSDVTSARMLEHGDPNREGAEVPPGFLTVLARGRPEWEAHTWAAWTSSSPGGAPPLPRSALAHWVTDLNGGAGPLVARVIVNRLWQYHFGEGLVRTANDFGKQGDRPLHAELLDWLAQELVESGWRLKHIQRLIVTSAAYRQDGSCVPAQLIADPENRLFGRYRPRRLAGELLRDALLSIGGNLNPHMGGPGIKPAIPPDAIFATAPKHGEVWPANVQDGPATWRRSVYIVAQRSNPVPFLQTFDGPDAAASCARRSTTTVPTQALVLMNDPFTRDQARRLADRVLAGGSLPPAEQIRQTFRQALTRAPSPDELEQALIFLSRQATRYTGDSRRQALADLGQVLFQTNEFIYID